MYGIGIKLASGLVVQDIERPLVLHALTVWSSRVIASKVSATAITRAPSGISSPFRPEG